MLATLSGSREIRRRSGSGAQAGRLSYENTWLDQVAKPIRGVGERPDSREQRLEVDGLGLRVSTLVEESGGWGPYCAY